MEEKTLIINAVNSYLQMACKADERYIQLVRQNSPLCDMLSKLTSEIYNKPFWEIIMKNNLFWIKNYDNELCGYIELQTSDEKDIYELGIEIFEQYRNNGIGTESIRAFTDFIYQQRDINMLKIRISPENKRSIHVFERLGAVFTGTECYIKGLKEWFPESELTGLNVQTYKLYLPLRKVDKSIEQDD